MALQKPAAGAAAPAGAGANAFGQMATNLTQKAEPQQQKVPPKGAAKQPNYNTQTGVASPEMMAKNRAAGKAEAPYGFDQKTGKPNPAPAAAPAPSGEKTIANPVATVGTKRATNIGQQTFDTQTGKALPGQSINAIRKKAEYGTGALGAARKRIKAGAAAPAESKTTTRPALAESFSLFRKK